MSISINSQLYKADVTVNFINDLDLTFNSMNSVYIDNANIIECKLAENIKNVSIVNVKKFIGEIFRKCINEGYHNVDINLNNYYGSFCTLELVRVISEVYYLVNYKFDRYLSKKNILVLSNINITIACDNICIYEQKINEGSTIGMNTCISRNFVNTPSNRLTPEIFARSVTELLSNSNVDVNIKNEVDIRNLGMHAFLEVSKGAINKPILMILKYLGNPNVIDEVTAIIGKGITYDSGGLSLKSKKGMITMHHDMAGASDAVCAVKAISEMGLKINIVAVIPLCENMLSPIGYRPGDIIDTMDGKTVLIKSTDAEGRLVIVDAITYAMKYENVKRVIDIATLTGGAVSAYGPLVSAIAVTDDELRKDIFKASELSGSRVWEMPLIDEYISYLKCEHADIANSSNGEGSSMINAALFIREFTNNLPWLHIDIAATSWTTKNDGIFSYGATGVGVGLLYYLLNK